MFPIRYQNLSDEIINGRIVSPDEASQMLAIESTPEVFFMLAHANAVRQHYKDDKIDLCAIINARSGKCSENCSFCAQSAHHKTDVEEYPLMSVKQIVENARHAVQINAQRVGIVTSGKSVDQAKDIDVISKALEQIKDEVTIKRCASLGALPLEILEQFKTAGLERYHHNLETSESFFPHICTTHSYQDRVETVKAAKQAGLYVCSGALFGLGESREQRIELAFALKELDVDSIPLNFLNPVEGTPAGNNKPMAPLEILKTIAVFRFILPSKDIRICGGREVNLRGLQSFIYLAGANGTLIGNYLTTEGRDHLQDLQDIEDLGLRPHIDDELYFDYSAFKDTGEKVTT